MKAWAGHLVYQSAQVCGEHGGLPGEDLHLWRLGSPMDCSDIGTEAHGAGSGGRGLSLPDE